MDYPNIGKYTKKQQVKTREFHPRPEIKRNKKYRKTAKNIVEIIYFEYKLYSKQSNQVPKILQSTEQLINQVF